MLLFPPRHGSPQPKGTSRTRGQTWADQRQVPTRGIYRLEVYTEPIPIPQKTGTRSHRITVVALFPEPLRETRDPTFAHNAAVRVPRGAATTRKRRDEGYAGAWDSGYKRRRNWWRKGIEKLKEGKTLPNCIQTLFNTESEPILSNYLNPNYTVFPSTPCANLGIGGFTPAKPPASLIHFWNAGLVRKRGITPTSVAGAIVEARRNWHPHCWYYKRWCKDLVGHRTSRFRHQQVPFYKIGPSIMD